MPVQLGEMRLFSPQELSKKFGLTFTRLLAEKGIFIKEEFLEMVRVVNKEMNRK